MTLRAPLPLTAMGLRIFLLQPVFRAWLVVLMALGAPLVELLARLIITALPVLLTTIGMGGASFLRTAFTSFIGQ
jgi:hypothetical protein